MVHVLPGKQLNMSCQFANLFNALYHALLNKFSRLPFVYLWNYLTLTLLDKVPFDLSFPYANKYFYTLLFIRQTLSFLKHVCRGIYT